MNNIYLMNHTMSAYQEQREAEEAAYQASRETRKAQCNDICRAISVMMSYEDFIAWVDAQPARGFYDAACIKLLSLMRLPSWIVELAERYDWTPDQNMPVIDMDTIKEVEF